MLHCPFEGYLQASSYIYSKSHLQGRVFHVSVLFLCNLCTSSCFTAGDGHEMSHVDVINVHGRTLNSVISFIYPDVHSFYTLHVFVLQVRHSVTPLPASSTFITRSLIKATHADRFILTWHARVI